MAGQLGERLEESVFTGIEKVSLPKVAYVQHLCEFRGLGLDEWNVQVTAAGIHCADVIVGAKTAETHAWFQDHGSETLLTVRIYPWFVPLP